MASGRSVVLVHGIYDSARSMRHVATALARAGWNPLCLSFSPNDGSVGLEVSARQLRDEIARELPAAARFDLVGFSMGGLIARCYAQTLGGAARIDHLITISAPNRGTILARLSDRKACQQMRPGSDFLRSLNVHDEKFPPLLNLWTAFDLVILPATHSRLEFAKNRRVISLAHPLMVCGKTSLGALIDALSAKPAAGAQ